MTFIMTFKFATENINNVEKFKQSIVKVFFKKNIWLEQKFLLHSCSEASTVERQ